VSQAAGSYGGVAFMLQAVLFIIVMIVLLGWPSSIYLLHQFRNISLTFAQQIWILTCFASAAGLSIVLWLTSMRAGVAALERMGE
jgi:Mn2+/Fe2+ NRAMP family transporter